MRRRRGLLVFLSACSLLISLLASGCASTGRQDSELERGPLARELPVLGEALVYSSARFTEQARFASKAGSLSLDLNPYLYGRVFLEHHKARFHRLDSGISFDISEVWFGAGLQANLVPQWLSVSVMAGSMYYIHGDEHLNRKVFPDAGDNDGHQGTLWRGVVTLSHPDRRFRFDLSATYNDRVHGDQERQYYYARLTAPVWQSGDFVLEVGAQGSYFRDNDLTYQSGEVGVLIGPRYLLSDSAVLGLDLGVSYIKERNDFINLGDSQEGLAATIDYSILHW